jgi:carbon-monoxide dehydrogenase medium subunit
MRTFAYARPGSLAEAVALLTRVGPDARALAGGTDLVIGLRDETVQPRLVVDLKRIPELGSGIVLRDGVLAVGARSVMADIVANEHVRRHFVALAEAANVVGSVQIRNRATMAGNICHASPAADTTPPLLVYGARVVVAGPGGTRRVPIEDFIVGPHRTILGPGDLVLAIELPIPVRRVGAAYTRLTRRRGTDLASVTLCCAVDTAGVTRIAYGSVGPLALLVVDESGVLADPVAPDEVKAPLLDRLFSDASPSPRSLRAGPAYRLAMLRVLGARALRTAIERLAEERTR